MTYQFVASLRDEQQIPLPVLHTLSSKEVAHKVSTSNTGPVSAVYLSRKTGRMLIAQNPKTNRAERTDTESS